MRFFLLLVTFLVVAILPATFAGSNSAIAASTQKTTNKLIASVFSEEDVVTTNNLRTEEVELLGNDANGIGYFQMYIYGTNGCDDNSLNYVAGIRLNTCVPNDDKKEQAYVLYGTADNGVIYGRRQSYADAACTKKRGYPQKITFHSGECHDGVKLEITDGFQGVNQHRGVMTAIYQKPQACANHRWNGIIMFAGAPFGACQDDQPDEKYTDCGDTSFTTTVYSSEGGQCSGSGQTHTVDKLNCVTVDGLTVTQYCI